MRKLSTNTRNLYPINRFKLRRVTKPIYTPTCTLTASTGTYSRTNTHRWKTMNVYVNSCEYVLAVC